MTPIDTAELERLADECREMGNAAHQQPGASKYMRTLWKAEKALREALAHRKAEAWQPIETAPLVHSVLVFRPAMWGGKGHIGVARWNTDEYAKHPKPFWKSCEGWIGKTEDRAYPPTHWQPLPAPPEAEGGCDERA